MVCRLTSLAHTDSVLKSTSSHVGMERICTALISLTWLTSHKSAMVSALQHIQSSFHISSMRQVTPALHHSILLLVSANDA